MTTAARSLKDLHPELRSRVLAASGNAEHRAIERLQQDDAPDEYVVLAMSGETVVLMRLSQRDDGSVAEDTETFLVADTTVLPDTGTTTIEVTTAGGTRRFSIPPTLGEALVSWLR